MFRGSNKDIPLFGISFRVRYINHGKDEKNEIVSMQNDWADGEDVRPVR